MATLLKIVATGVAGVLLGLLATIAMLDPGTRGVVAGPWRGSPRDGTPEIDPYALAAVERAGVLPLGAAEGLSFVAANDSSGDALSPACDYAVTGPMPAARYWTLSVLSPEGFPIANPAERYALTSGEVLWDASAPIVIAVSSAAQSGNWLPVGRDTPFVLALRLYDTGLSAVGTTFDAASMPTIRKVGCR